MGRATAVFVAGLFFCSLQATGGTARPVKSAVYGLSVSRLASFSCGCTICCQYIFWLVLLDGTTSRNTRGAVFRVRVRAVFSVRI